MVLGKSMHMPSKEYSFIQDDISCCAGVVNKTKISEMKLSKHFLIPSDEVTFC